MKPKRKPCDGCGRSEVIWKNHGGEKFCKRCWSCHPSNVKPKPTARKALPSRSAKRTQQEKEYSKLRKDFLERRSMCEMRIPQICTQKATDVHHKNGRTGDNYLNVSTWIPGCRQCHDWVHNNPRLARELGYLY